MKYIETLQIINFKRFWDILFQVECFISITRCSLKKGFCLPVIYEGCIHLEKAYFPLINNVVKYDITFDNSLNILNGPNMGGKSTFLKTITLCCYLGNIGVPIPSSKAEIPFFESFNVNFNTKDNYKNGTSHFMNEVISIKEFILSSKSSGSVFGCFDELFNTTNPEEALRLISYLFSNLKLNSPSFFIISTHLDIEIFKDREEIGFFHPSTKLNGNKIQFDYSITKGISKLKLGEKLFQDAGIMDII
ncbi:hypothetical protein IC221_16240 [Flammeovirga sp. EKP202]|nr:hypothetical protein [Flammeovirga sp. EKP202]